MIKSFIRLLQMPLVILLVFCASASAQAPDAELKPEQVTVYGRIFTVQPFMPEDSSITWEKAKAYLPNSLSKPGNSPLSDDEILKEIDVLVAQKASESKKATERAVDKYMSEHPAENREIVALDINQSASAEEAGNLYPELQRTRYENRAMFYLSSMLREAMHKPQKY